MSTMSFGENGSIFLQSSWDTKEETEEHYNVVVNCQYETISGFLSSSNSTQKNEDEEDEKVYKEHFGLDNDQKNDEIFNAYQDLQQEWFFEDKSDQGKFLEDDSEILGKRYNHSNNADLAELEGLESLTINSKDNSNFLINEKNSVKTFEEESTEIYRNIKIKEKNQVIKYFDPNNLDQNICKNDKSDIITLANYFESFFWGDHIVKNIPDFLNSQSSIIKKIVDKEIFSEDWSGKKICKERRDDQYIKKAHSAMKTIIYKKFHTRKLGKEGTEKEMKIFFELKDQVFDNLFGSAVRDGLKVDSLNEILNNEKIKSYLTPEFFKKEVLQKLENQTKNDVHTNIMKKIIDFFTIINKNKILGISKEEEETQMNLLKKKFASGRSFKSPFSKWENLVSIEALINKLACALNQWLKDPVQEKKETLGAKKLLDGLSAWIQKEMKDAGVITQLKGKKSQSQKWVYVITQPPQ